MYVYIYIYMYVYNYVYIYIYYNNDNNHNAIYDCCRVVCDLSSRCCCQTRELPMERAESHIVVSAKICTTIVLRVWGTGSGFLRKSTGANGRKRLSTNTYRNNCVFVLTEISENIRKPPGVNGRMQPRNPVFQFPLSITSLLAVSLNKYK